MPLYIGQSLTMYPEGLQEIGGTIRSVNEAFVGIEFDLELPHPVFERLRAEHGIDFKAVEPAAPGAAQEAVPDPEGNAPAQQKRKQNYGSLSSLSTRRGNHPLGVKRTPIL